MVDVVIHHETLSALDVIDTLRRVVARKGPTHIDPLAHVNMACQYIYTPEVVLDRHANAVGDLPDVCRCVVGEIMHELGVLDEDLGEFNQYGSVYEFYSYFHRDDIPRGAPRVTVPALTLLSEAQRASDNADPWRVVLQRAEAAFERFSVAERETRDVK